MTTKYKYEMLAKRLGKAQRIAKRLSSDYLLGFDRATLTADLSLLLKDMQGEFDNIIGFKE